MARIDVLPSIDIIRGLKGILDFYLWRGLPCVRAWPRWRPARQTDASKTSALLFGAVIKAFALTHSAVLDQLAVEAIGIPRTTRDIYVSGVYGNLHEASMSDFLTLLTQCRDFLSSLTDLLHALDSIDTDELVVNVDQSVLPPLAATTTNQATAITALQKLDDLQDALESKALDRLLVRGQDQLLSIKDTLEDRITGVISGADGYIESNTPPATEYWHVTRLAARDDTSATTAMRFQHQAPGQIMPFHLETRAFAANEPYGFPCELWLKNPHVLRVYFLGGLIADDVRFALYGKRMTLET